MGQNGVPQNTDKFQFGTKTVEWLGEKSVKPLKKHREVIKSFPTPLNITDLRSFMALLKQIAYCYATSPAPAPLRHLLKSSDFGLVRGRTHCSDWWGMEWVTFYARNIETALIRTISIGVKKDGKSAVQVVGSAIMPI